MKIIISKTKELSGRQAAAEGGDLVARAIAEHGEARIILATGSSQFDMLAALVARSDIDWTKCSVFHLDEYVGLAPAHPASFVGYLMHRIVDRVPGLLHFEAINGLADPEAEIARLNGVIGDRRIDVAFIGIGENGHLAFNDPPADFKTAKAYIGVELDTACRQQQVSEGWFAALDEVPSSAISMSIPQILRSRAIICTVPEARKAEAVRNAVEGPLTNLCPASALQEHAGTWLFLDTAAASGLASKD